MRITDVAKKELNGRLFIQLDHGRDEKLIIKCAKKGFDAIMISSDSMDYKNSINYIRHFSDLVKKINKNIIIEAELGIIGDDNIDSVYTDPKLVRHFLSQTRIDLLAISVGNRHGFKRPKPPLKRDLIEEISNESSVPLALHGADWVDGQDLKFAIKKNIKKINIGPELRLIAGHLIKNEASLLGYDTTDHRQLINKIVRSLADCISEKLKII